MDSQTSHRPIGEFSLADCFFDSKKIAFHSSDPSGLGGMGSSFFAFYLSKEDQTPVCCWPSQNFPIVGKVKGFWSAMNLYKNLAFRPDALPSNENTETNRLTNLNPKLIEAFATALGLLFLPEKKIGNLCFADNNADLRDDFKQVFFPEDLFHYIYGSFWIWAFEERSENRDFKIKVPPMNSDFWEISRLGKKVLALGSQTKFDEQMEFPVSGSNQIEKISALQTADAFKIHINSQQYFTGNLQIVWKSFSHLFTMVDVKKGDNRILSAQDIQDWKTNLSRLVQIASLISER